MRKGVRVLGWEFSYKASEGAVLQPGAAVNKARLKELITKPAIELRKVWLEEVTGALKHKDYTAEEARQYATSFSLRQRQHQVTALAKMLGMSESCIAGWERVRTTQPDFYRYLAAQKFGLKYIEVTDAQRQEMKNVVYVAAYSGMGKPSGATSQGGRK